MGAIAKALSIPCARATSAAAMILRFKANANLAAVNYHFGSKQDLIVAVVDDIVRPVNERRLFLLDDIDYSRSRSIKEIVHAFIDPVFDACNSESESDNKYYKLISRCISSRDERVSSIIIKQFV